MAAAGFRFGDGYCLDAVRLELWRGSERVKLSTTPCAVLASLIAHRPHFVEGRVIAKALGATLDPITIRVHIHEIREAFRRDERDVFIANNRHGSYAFAADAADIEGIAFVTDGPQPTIRALGPRLIPIGTKWISNQSEQKGAIRTTWTLTGTSSFEGSPIYLVSSGPIITLVDVATLNHIGTIREGKMVSSSLPTEGVFSWPLVVGRKWIGDFCYTDHVNGKSFSSVASEYEVAAYEPVTAPAGTLMAFRIDGKPLRYESVTRTAWYAPEPGVVVRRIWVRDGGTDYRGTSLRNVMELIEYPGT